MSVFSRVGAAEARAHLAEAKRGDRGIQFTFTHLDDAPVNLYGLRISEEIYSKRAKGQRAEMATLALSIPVQTGLLPQTDSARPIRFGDKIEWPLSSGRILFVASVAIAENSNGYIFEVTCNEKKMSNLGVS